MNLKILGHHHETTRHHTYHFVCLFRHFAKQMLWPAITNWWRHHCSGMKTLSMTSTVANVLSILLNTACLAVSLKSAHAVRNVRNHEEAVVLAEIHRRHLLMLWSVMTSFVFATSCRNRKCGKHLRWICWLFKYQSICAIENYADKIVNVRIDTINVEW